MIRIKDETGQIISGIYREESGAILVDDSDSYGKYLKEKERTMEVVQLTSKVDALEKMVRQLLDEIKK